MKGSATAAIDLVRRAGVAHDVRACRLPERHGRERTERPDDGLEAAAALGVDAARVYKTLIVVMDEHLGAAVVGPIARGG